MAFLHATRRQPSPVEDFFHTLGADPKDDRLIYEEADTGMFVGVGGTRRNDWIMISIGDHETSEYRVLAAGDPLGPQTIVSPRETGLQYDIEEGGDIFFILTNADGAKDFKVMTAPASDPVRANWQELIPHQPGRLILSLQSFKDFLVRLERVDSLPRSSCATGIAAKNI
jgi:oligopeptidase B